MHKIKIVSYVGGLILLLVGTACTPKQRPRQVHESGKDWSVKQKTAEAVTAQNVDYNKLNLDAMEQALAGPVQALEAQVLQPLGRYLLDIQYMSTPIHRNKRLEQALTIFNNALFKVLNTPGTLKDSARRDWLTRYENTVFAGCTADLKKGCVNAQLFSGDHYSSQVLVFVATQDDEKLDQEIKTYETASRCVEQSENCRAYINLRYRRLAMAFSLKRTDYSDQKLTFAFMKYIRALDALVVQGKEIGYLTNTYGSIFEILISRYQPKDVKTSEFRKFIENFSPWTYSNKGSDVFRHGSKMMLDLATQCCMYSEDGQYKLSQSLRLGLQESQKERGDSNRGNKMSSDTVSFHTMVKQLLSRNKEKSVDILSNLGLKNELSRLENLDSSFYNEYFFIVDRLYNEHLDSSEALRILERTNGQRAKTQLLSTLDLYLKVQLTYLTVDTIDFMNNLYNSKISSDLVFSEALMVSRDISTRWMKAQNRMDLLNSFAGSYFKRFSEVSEQFYKTSDLFRSVNRNIHYLSVYPNMIGMTYYLSKNQAVVKARSWWGEEFEVKPDTVVNDLFDGTDDSAVKGVWFRFATTPVVLSRERLFYAFHYALKTQAFETFSVDEKSQGQSDRAKFFELTLGKYLSVQKRKLENGILNLESDILKNSTFDHLGRICRYEMDRTGKVEAPGSIGVDLLQIGSRTYTGFERGTPFNLIRQMISANAQPMVAYMYSDIEPKLTFVRAIISILENHMKESGEMKNKEQTAKKELEDIRGIIKNIENLQQRYLSIFAKYRKNLYACSQQLYKVEMMRSYRLIDEERQYLGQVYDMLRSVQNLKSVAEQGRRLKELNDKYFPPSKVKFDRLLSDGYLMSRYDFLMRVKTHIENDIFIQPTERERKVYGAELSHLIKRRAVRVEMPPGLERLEIYTSETPNTLSYTENKEQFINQGIRLLSGSTGSMASWPTQGDELKLFMSYLHTLVDLYLMDDINTDDAKVTAEEILKTYKEIIEMVNLNDFDIENASVMGLEGRVATASLEGFLLENTSLQAQPLLRSLMRHVYDRSGFGVGDRGLLSKGRTLSDMLTDDGVVIFDPGNDFKKSLAEVYGAPIRRILNRASELFSLMPDLENKSDWQALFRTRLRLNENGQVVDIAGSRGRHSLQVVDTVLLSDLNFARQNYTSKTGNMFETKSLTTGGR